ncbi:N-terminal cleavage protein [Opitutaceae bacterium TAV5]|nr:N-terminal cleavage protein [Opitutaceae bacterium TAV5]
MNTPTPACAIPPLSARLHDKEAFTLIELLTVIAIIGILAAILIPVTGTVREKAKKAQCVSNLHQIGIGLLAYANDNKAGRLPRGHPTEGRTLWDTYASGDPRGAAGLGALQYDGYLGGIAGIEVRGDKRSRIFDCPSRLSGAWDSDVNWGDYYYNFTFTRYTDAPQGALLHNIDPGQAIAFDFVPAALTPVHDRESSVNVLYIDGSVKALTKDKFKTTNRITAFDK